MKNEIMNFLSVVVGIWGLIGLILLYGSGCATQSNICQTIPEGETSLICVASENVGTTPEELAKWLKISTLVIVDSEAATAQEVLDLINEAQGLIDIFREDGKEITPYMILEWINAEYAMLSPQAMIMLEILDPFEGIDFPSLGIPEVLSDFDLDLLEGHLAEQEALVKSLM